LGTVAKRNVGEGENQMPDMSFFTSTSGDTSYQRLPGGKLLVKGIVTMTASSLSVTFPQAFKDNSYRIFAIDRGNGCVPIGASNSNASSAMLYRAGKAYNYSGVLVDITGATAVSYFAIGEAP